jgi:type I restriction enzyme S subunit
LLDKDSFDLENKRTNVQPGDVLLTIVGTIGRSAVVPGGIEQFSLQRSVAVLKPNKEIVDSRFLMLCLRANLAMLVNNARGAAQQGIYLNQIKELQISLPTLDEQRHIVERLDSAFSEVAKAEILMRRNIENVSFLQKSILAKYLDSANDTHTHRLGDIFKIGSAKRVLQSQWRKAGVPFYRGREITRLTTYGRADNELFIDESLYDEYSSKYGVPQADDIMLTAIGTIGNPYIVQPDDKFYFKDASVLWMKKITDINSRYIDYWIKSDKFKSQLEPNGTTVDTLTIGKLQSLQINLPDESEQERIVAKLDSLFVDSRNLLKNYTAKLQKLADLRQSLLAEAFAS